MSPSPAPKAPAEAWTTAGRKREKLAEKVAAFRIWVGLTQVELALLAGVSRGTVARWESGQAEVADLFAVPLRLSPEDRFAAPQEGVSTPYALMVRSDAMRLQGDVVEAALGRQIVLTSALCCDTIERYMAATSALGLGSILRSRVSP